MARRAKIFARIGIKCYVHGSATSHRQYDGDRRAATTVVTHRFAGGALNKPVNHLEAVLRNQLSWRFWRTVPTTRNLHRLLPPGGGFLLADSGDGIKGNN